MLPFFLLVAIYGIINWVETAKYRYFISGILGFIAAGFFHGALLIGGIILLIIFTYSNYKIFFRSYFNNRLHYKSFMVVILSSFILATYFSGKIYIQYLGDFKTTISMERIMSTINVRMKGEASYPEWTRINSPVEVVYKIPVRSVYFLFSPFPWDIKKFSHIMGAIDGLIYLILVYFIFCNRKAIWNDPALRIILLILFCYLLIWGVGISNFGAASRHRSKFVIELIILSAPLIPKIPLKKQKLL